MSVKKTQAGPKSPLAAFRHRAYAVIWTATVAANIGTWMYSSATAWLMTSLDPDPFMVSLVQVATTLPMFLFALPAGALADIVNKRRLLLAAESAIMILSACFAALVWLNLVTPITLLVFTFLIEASAAVTAPAWQSIVPTLVTSDDLPAAVAANSVGVNISRAIGPALGGLITVAAGVAAPFGVNAISNLGTIGALIWWRPPTPGKRPLPAEHWTNAIRTGARYVRNSPPVRASLLRAVGFFLFASAYWALLPLVARAQLGGGPEMYGALLGAIGVGALGGALLLPYAKQMLGSDRLVSAGAVATAVALVLFGFSSRPGSAIVACFVAGISWITVIATLNVSVQFALPEWVRGRGLAVYVTVLFGAMTVGSIIWGELASIVGLSWAHFIAATGSILAIFITRRWKLKATPVDLAPSMHWPAPVVAEDIEADQGPVLVTVEYRVSAENREAFLVALEKLAHERRRDGAYAWGVFEDTSRKGRFVETFLVESWLEHLRQHERVTNADRVLEHQVHRLLQEKPDVTHLVSAAPKARSK